MARRARARRRAQASSRPRCAASARRGSRRPASARSPPPPGRNVASISYHFGGKEGLRAACAEHIVALMGKVLAAARAGDALPADPAAAEAALDRRSCAAWSRFLLLEPRGAAGRGLHAARDGPAVERARHHLRGALRGRARAASARSGAPPPASRPESRGGPPRGLRRPSARSSTSTSPGRWSSGAWAGRRSAPPRPAAIADTVVRNLLARLRADRRDAP